MVKPTIHILGAGVSGLTLAYELAKKAVPVRVYEKTKYVGGLARTEKSEVASYDCGPHLFHSNNPNIKNYWTSLLGNKISTPNLYGANFKEGRLYEYPLSKESISNQFNSDQVKLIEKQLESRDLTSMSRANNYAEYVRALAGDFLHDLFFKKYPEKLWGISTKNLSAKFAPRRVEIREESRAFHSGDGKWAAVLDGGCGTLASALEEKLVKLGAVVEFNSNLTSLETSSDGKIISAMIFNSDQKIDLVPGDVVVSTIPVTKLASFLGVDSKLWFRSLKIVCVLIGNKKKLPGNYDWLYFDSDDLIFHRVTIQNSFSESGIPNGHSILSCEISYSDGDQIDLMDEKELLDKTIKDLLSSGMIDEEILVKESYLIDAGYVYPGIENGYELELAKVNADLESVSNLYRLGALAEFEYADLQVLTSKSIDLAEILTKKHFNNDGLKKREYVKPYQKIEFDGKFIGDGYPPYIIAEAGLNHNGDLSMAKMLVDQAKASGASAIKFQTYNKGRVSKKVRTSLYYEDLIDSQESISDLLDRIILPESELKILFDYAKKIGITIFSTPFDIESFLMLESLNCPAYKISSMDLVNLPLIRRVAKSGKPVIMSTGMSTIGDIDDAVKAVLEERNPALILMHCVSSYPCPASIANLSRIQKLADLFNVVTGYSDHTTGIDISMAAIALGAKVLEKHFTIDRRLDGPDHNFSLLPEELNQLVISANRIYDATINQGMTVNNSEIITALNLRRSIFFSRNLSKGSKISESDLIIKSPGIGLHPRYYGELIGAQLNVDILEDEPVLLEYFINY